MKYGYARVSSKGQKLTLQTEALRKEGCDIIVTEKASVIEKRPKLDALLKNMKSGDTLVVWRLDRLGREMFSLLNLILEFSNRGINFEAINEQLDTKTAQGKLMIALSAYFAEMERELIKERRKAGRAYAKKGGRPKGLSKRHEELAPTLIKMYEELEGDRYKYSISEIVKATGVKQKTFYNILESKNIARVRGQFIKK